MCPSSTFSFIQILSRWDDTNLYWYRGNFCTQPTNSDPISYQKQPHRHIRKMFYQLSRHFLAQSSWLIKLTTTFSVHHLFFTFPTSHVYIFTKLERDHWVYFNIQYNWLLELWVSEQAKKKCTRSVDLQYNFMALHRQEKFQVRKIQSDFNDLEQLPDGRFRLSI